MRNMSNQPSDALVDPEYRKQVQGLKDVTAALNGESSSPVVFSTDVGSVLNRKMGNHTTFEVSGTRMLHLLKVGSGKLHRWELGFFCLSPQPGDYKFGDAPKEPWVGSVMIQQMVISGAIKATGELTDAPPMVAQNKETTRSRPRA